MACETKPSWDRFTFVDAVTLGAALGLAIWLQTSWMLVRTDQPFQRAEGPAIWAASSLMWGSVFAGPPIVLAHFFRRRRTAPSAGEWLWLVPIPLYLTFLVLLYFGELSIVQSLFGGVWAIGVTLAYISAQSVLSLGAFVRLVRSFSARHTDGARRWADRFGGLVCAVFGPATVFGLIHSLRQTP
jgi:hypothetical protein